MAIAKALSSGAEATVIQLAETVVSKDLVTKEFADVQQAQEIVSAGKGMSSAEDFVCKHADIDSS